MLKCDEHGTIHDAKGRAVAWIVCDGETNGVARACCPTEIDDIVTAINAHDNLSKSLQRLASDPTCHHALAEAKRVLKFYGIEN